MYPPGGVEKIGLYDPYLEALGGGEKYILVMAEEAARMPGAHLVLFSPHRPDVHAWERLNVFLEPGDFEWVAADDQVVTEQSRDLGLLVTMSNDVPVLNHARRAVAMVQFPTRARDAPLERARSSLARALGRSRAGEALGSYDLFICNSEFTRDHIKRRLGVHAMVLAPPVDPPLAQGLKKERRILSVGRFYRGEHHKHQEVLIRAFAELRSSFAEAANWELHLVGGAEHHPSTQRWLEELYSLARGAPVHLHVNADAATLGKLYATSSLFWHATGYGERARRHPERLEHFGIATVEAMMGGAVPLVVPLGGQAEIVRDGVNGRHWRSVGELVTRSHELIQNPSRAEALRATAREHARPYGKDRFLAEIREHVLKTPGAAN